MPGIRFLLVDALNLIRRVYAAQPGPDEPEKAERGLVSCSQSLERALREVNPTHALVVFEGPEPTWRHSLFPSYKANHKPMPEALRVALPGYREVFAALGVTSFELLGAEADDVIATLAAKVAAAGGSAVILSTDKSFLQLHSHRVTVRDHFARRDLGRDDIVDRFGVGPERLLDLLALTGDSTNAIPGILGVGAKTAAKLVVTWDSLDEITAVAMARLASGEGDSPSATLSPRLAGKLVAHREDAQLARTLLRLRTDLELSLNLKNLRYLA